MKFIVQTHIYTFTLLIITTFTLQAQPYPASQYYKESWNSTNTRPGSLLTTGTYILPLSTEGENYFMFPCVKSTKIISPYGPRGGRMHTGVDLKQNLGDSIVAAWDGVVRMAKESYYGYGKLVVIRHANGLETFYAHLSKLCVKENQQVKAGELIGLAGRTGRATTEHLHFETRFLYESFNPTTIIDVPNRKLVSDTLSIRNKRFKAGGTPAIMVAAVQEESLSDLFEDFSDTTATNTAITPKPAPATAPVKKTYHIVVQGDSLYKISKRYGVSISRLCQLNNMKESDILSLGRKIKLE